MAVDPVVYSATRQYLDWSRTHPRPGPRHYSSCVLMSSGAGIRISTDPHADYITTVPGGLTLMITGEPPAWPASFAIINLDVAFDIPDPLVACMREAIVAALTDAGHPFLPLSVRAVSGIISRGGFGRLELVDRDGLQCVFTLDRRYYISGYDSNESPPLYFLAALPGAVSTFAEGIEALKPPSVKLAEAQGIPVLRQGDMFAIATGHSTEDLKAMGAVFSTEVNRSHRPGGWQVVDWTITLVKSEITTFSRRRGLYGTAHTAKQLAYLPDDGTMFARGAIMHRPQLVLGEARNPDHTDLPLPGRKWYLVARNTVPIAGRG